MLETVHISHGHIFDRALQQGEAVVLCPDNLSCGPCSTDQGAHANARSEYWGIHAVRPRGVTVAVAASELKNAVGSAHARNVVLWADNSYAGRLFVWWALDALFDQIDTSALRVSAVIVGDRLAFRGPGKAGANDKRVPTQIDRELALVARSVWRSFASGQINEIGAAYCCGNRREKNVLGVGGTLGVMKKLFPRVAGDVLQLSQMDRNLLQPFARVTWRRPVDVLTKIERSAVYLTHETILERLAKWASADLTTRILDVRCDETATSRWGRFAYCLTNAGKQVLANGLQSLRHAPPLHVGGTVAYSPTGSWVVTGRSDELLWYEPQGNTT
jgi:hypothetical protein